MTTKLWTINDIKTACRVRGSHWFDPGTMRFFNGRVLSEVYQGDGGIFFVSSERYRDEPRKYTVRQFKPETADIDTIGDFNAMTKGKAIRAAKKLAGVTEATTDEAYKPVGEVEQFRDDLRAHGSKSATLAMAKRLMMLAAKHQRMMEDYCNGVEIYDAEGEPLPALRKLQKNIGFTARASGATEVVFQGDPRGATVKLKFADGATNDWGNEGWCVPCR